MKVLHAFTKHRGRGGAEKTASVSIKLLCDMGIETEAFTMDSLDLPSNILGRLQAGLNAFYAPDSVRKFSAFLDRFQPDLVHVYDLFPLISPEILNVCSQRGIPTVMTCIHYRLTCPLATHFRNGQICTECLHGKEHRAILNNCRGSLPESLIVAGYNAVHNRKFLRNVSHFIAPSEFTRRWIIDYAGVDPSKISTIFPVIDVSEDTVEGGTGDYIAFLGRFVYEKGIHTVIEAARISGLPLRLSRSSSSRVETDVPDHVPVVITHTHEELDEFYRNARVIVVPSVWLETFGMVAAEAMSHGKAVVASRIGALAELIEEGVNGLLFEPGNANDLATKLTQLWNRPDVCESMGRAARKKVLSYWTPQHHLTQLSDLYKSLCTRTGAPLPVGV